MSVLFKRKSTLTSNEKQKTIDNVNTGEVVPSVASDFIRAVSGAVHHTSDLVVKSLPPNLTLIYIENVMDIASFNNHILQDLFKQPIESPQDLSTILSISQVEITPKIEDAVQAMMAGAVLIHVEGYADVVLGMVPTTEGRQLSAPENESQVLGAQIAFNESLSTNVSLIRRYIKNPNLCSENFTVGKESNTSIALLYIHGIASDEMLNTLRQRIIDLEIDSVLDSSILAQLISDNSLSIFPQMLLTERPDKISAELLLGKLVVVVDGSSLVLACPYSFLEYFQSQEDQNQRWEIASFIRLLRFGAVVLSVFLTPIYVAALTFHYEVIPQSLLVPLSESRALVPFPPLFEALLIELIIELLREAGVRLPVKVGQTIGIVGGIVIGTAAVDAGFTSNILIIIVALAALASFTTPSYTMGNVIRVIRFPLILLAGVWGFYGIMLGFCFILIHLLRQSSLGSPYTAPFYPPRLFDWSDSLVRLPLPFTDRRPTNTRPKDKVKYKPEPINPEKHEQKVE
ncbi:spore germination protein [Sporosarcina oncorhynchi]|uniref:Spore germination protein n=1 Tax=Sporosarcina oncorhynchi TaxID=3056444 RepID=A0ABZ0L2N6_9BACL|nr:spore germination protein [Sporosarcina sp. T2O-4]WOV86871.1 spore germination protein [Sporosarcina sp. T2O-4]